VLLSPRLRKGRSWTRGHTGDLAVRPRVPVDRLGSPSGVPDIRLGRREQTAGDDHETFVGADAHARREPVPIRAGGIAPDDGDVAVVQLPDFGAVLGRAAVPHLRGRLSQPPLELRTVIGFPWSGHQVNSLSVADTARKLYISEQLRQALTNSLCATLHPHFISGSGWPSRRSGGRSRQGAANTGGRRSVW